MAVTPPHTLTVVTDSVGWGGAEISLGYLLGGLGRAWSVRLLGVDPVVLERLAGQRPDVERVVLPPLPRGRDLRALLAWRSALSAGRPDVVHANLTWGSSCLWPLAVAAAGAAPVVAVEHLPTAVESPWERWVKRRAARRWAAHVAVSAGAAREVEHFGGLPAGSVGVVHNGVPDLGPLPPRPPSPQVVLGSLARLDRLKGLDVLVRALVHLPHCRLVVGGDGDQRRPLEQLADRLGVRHRVELRGWVTDGRALLSDVDVFVLPSRREGFPLSVVEALLAGRPVVATDVGGVRESVQDGRTGLLVPPDDLPALTAALDRLARSPEERRLLGARGRELARERFTDAAMVVRYAALYDAVLSAGPSRSASRRAASAVTKADTSADR